MLRVSKTNSPVTKANGLHGVGVKIESEASKSDHDRTDVLLRRFDQLIERSELHISHSFLLASRESVDPTA